MKKKKKRLFDIIQIGQREDWASRFFDFFIVIVILLNVTVMFMETFDQLAKYKNVFQIIEEVTMGIFFVEYILRIWTAEYLYPQKRRIEAIGRFLISFDGLVQLFTILPFFFLTGFVALRMLRVVRIFHLFRINATYDSFHVITSILFKKKNQIFSSLCILIILMMSSSLCMYSAEHQAQPEVFDNAFSGLWWSISTILTVGYGDIYPITALGRCMAIIIAVLGVGVVAIPTGIISAGFVEQYTQMQRNTDKPIMGTVSVNVDASCPFIGLNQKELRTYYEMIPLLLIREGEVIINMGEKKVKLGDTLIYQSTDILNEVD